MWDVRRVRAKCFLWLVMVHVHVIVSFVLINYKAVDSCCCFFFFAKQITIKDAHTYGHTLTPMNAHTHTLPL
jgi:hypothetical protein